MVLTPHPPILPTSSPAEMQVTHASIYFLANTSEISQPAWQGFRNQMSVAANCRAQMKLSPEQCHQNSSTYTRGQ